MPKDLLADFNPAEIPEWVCNICNNTNCYNCHPSICQKHLEMEDEASARKIREISKLCPKRGCGRRLMRSGGCAHMTCRIVGGERPCLFPKICGGENRKKNSLLGRKWLWHALVLELQGHLAKWAPSPCSKLSLASQPASSNALSI
jgi:hypothetical protein